jgi:hypothetical protein
LHPDWIFVFGDNTAQFGKREVRTGRRGGQAVIRGLPNAMGVPTKKHPTMAGGAFFDDAELDANVAAIASSLRAIEHRATTDLSITRVVFPADGLGTGRAQLATRAPETAKQLDALVTAMADRLEPGSGARLTRCALA